MSRSHRTRSVLCTAFLVCAGTMQANIFTYNDQGAFNGAAAGLLTQTFGGVYADLTPLGNGAALSNNPLDNSTNAAMLPGLAINATTNSGGDIIVLTPGFAGTALANYGVFSNFFQGLNVSFGAGVNAASLDVLSLFDSGNVTITALDPSNNVLGKFTVNNAPNTGSGEFIGFITSGGAGIGSLDIVTSSPGGITPGLDQVQFGNIDPTPEPSFFVLTGLAFTGLLAFALHHKFHN